MNGDILVRLLNAHLIRLVCGSRCIVPLKLCCGRVLLVSLILENLMSLHRSSNLLLSCTSSSDQVLGLELGRHHCCLSLELLSYLLVLLSLFGRVLDHIKLLLAKLRRRLMKLVALERRIWIEFRCLLLLALILHILGSLQAPLVLLG